MQTARKALVLGRAQVLQRSKRTWPRLIESAPVGFGMRRMRHGLVKGMLFTGKPWFLPSNFMGFPVNFFPIIQIYVNSLIRFLPWVSPYAFLCNIWWTVIKTICILYHGNPWNIVLCITIYCKFVNHTTIRYKWIRELFSPPEKQFASFCQLKNCAHW